MSNKFQLDVNDVLGFSYQEFIQHLRGMALSSPKDYMELRSKVLQDVKRKAVGDMYDTLFEVMSKGTIGEKTVGKLGSEPKYKPNYPSQKINDLCISIASDLADRLNQVVDIICPDFESIANGKMQLKGKADQIDLGTVGSVV